MVHEGIKPEGEVLKSLQYFIPLVGPAIMLSDANVKVDIANRKVDVENIGEGIAG